MEKKISVIVPVYQVEEYLETCIESIINQSYKNLEIILIDDGSKDNCPSICDRYQKMDPRVIVIHKENGGLSSARNAGLDIATGELVTFVDSDDYMEEDMLAVLLSNLEEHMCDISVCFWKEVFCDGTKVDKTEKRKKQQKVECMDNVQAMEKMLYQRGTDSCAWGKLFKRSLFEEIRFPISKIYEDIAIMYAVFDKAEKVVFSDYAGYGYLQRDTSIMKENFSENKMSLITFVEDNERFIKEKYPMLMNAAVSRTVRANFHIYLQIPSEKKYACYRRRIEENIRTRRSVVMKDKEAAKGTKGALLITYLGFGVLRAAKNLKNWGKTI